MQVFHISYVFWSACWPPVVPDIFKNGVVLYWVENLAIGFFGASSYHTSFVSVSQLSRFSILLRSKFTKNSSLFYSFQWFSMFYWVKGKKFEENIWYPKIAKKYFFFHWEFWEHQKISVVRLWLFGINSYLLYVRLRLSKKKGFIYLLLIIFCRPKFWYYTHFL